MQNLETRPHSIIIVGAGPIGLVTALLLAREGVGSLLLDASTEVCHGSRAIVYTRRSMEILAQAGVADAVLQRALPWHAGTSFVGTQAVYRMEAPQDAHDRFAALYNLSQPELESLLLAAVAQQPLIQLQRGMRVVELASSANEHPRLRAVQGERSVSLQADWVVACDGARSTLRQCQRLRMEGTAYEGRFVIADLHVDLPLPTERRAYFDPPGRPGNTVLMHRQPDQLWRIDYQLPPGASPEEALAPATLASNIQAQLDSMGFGDRPWRLAWSSVYSARALTLPSYLHQRVLYAGDAAHLLPIFGVRGANTGFQDAQNLAWKLAHVLRGWADASLLQSYSDERVEAAREIMAEAGKSTRFMTPPTPGFRALRDATLALSLTQPFVRPLFHWRTARAHVYASSSLNTPDEDGNRWPAGPALGEVAPDVMLTSGQHLLGTLPAGWAVLYFSALSALPAALHLAIETWNQQASHAPLCAIPLSAPAAWARYGVTHEGAAYLLRPDQHIAARWAALTPAKLQAALHRALKPHHASSAPADPQGAAPEIPVPAAASSTPLSSGYDAPSHAAPSLPTADLEAVYDALAGAIDRAQATEAGATGLLTRLALLLAQSLPDASTFERRLAVATAMASAPNSD